MGLTQITTGGVDDNINIDSNTLKVDGTNNRVGIGTAAPQRALVVSDAGDEGFEFFPGSSDTGNTLNHYDRGSSSFIDITTNADKHIFGRADGEKMRIDSSGNVGIGSTNPVADLVVSNGGASGIELQPEITSNTNRITNYNRSTSSYNTFRLDAAQQEFFISGSEKLRIDSSGNVGIGTSSPTTPLQVHSSTTASTIRITNSSSGATSSDGLIIQENGNDAYIWNKENSFISLGTNNAERARLDSSGRLLVNTSSSFNDGSTIQLAGSDSHLGLKYTGTSGGNETQIRWFDFRNQANAAIANKLQDDGSGTQAANLVFKTANAGTLSERMRIGYGGMISASADAGWESQILYNKNGANSTRSFIIGRHSATALTGASGTAGTISFKVTTNGNVTNTNNSYGQISDVKLKENIVSANSQWDDIKSIQVRNFNFKEETGNPTHTQIGVVAQEIETVSPGLISESPDFDVEGNDLGTVTKSVNYSVLYMKAVKALQEAMDRIETLETKVAALEAAE